MRKMILLGTAITALNLSSPSLAQNNQDETEKDLVESGVNGFDAFTKMFENMFPSDNTPIEPALLAKSERIAGAIVPNGSYRKIMAETLQKIIEPMMQAMDEIPLAAIASFAGVGEDEITLKEGATLSELMIIVDPHYKQRNRAMMTRITDILIDLSDDMEPPIRSGLAQAYARRFTAGELDAAARFYETEAGAKIAGESLAIFASPEVMSASMEMMPKFTERLMGTMEELSEGSDDLPPRRTLDDLSDEERDKMADLMGLDRKTLTESGDHLSYEMAADAAEAAAKAAAQAAAQATCETADMCNSEEQDEQWADPENWTAAEREKVARLEAEHQTAFEKYFAAQEAAQENARKRSKKD